MTDLTTLTVPELLALHARIAEVLRTRKVLRSANAPTGDLAEYLFCQAFDWEQTPNSNRRLDAYGRDGTRYQIKGRRMTRHSASRQVSAIRDLPGRHFDVLAGVLFNEDYSVSRAALIPREVVEQRSRYIAHTNSYLFHLQDDLWTLPTVQDVTEALQSVVFEPHPDEVEEE